MTTTRDFSLEDTKALIDQFSDPKSYKATHKMMTQKYVISSFLNHISAINNGNSLEYTITLAPSETSILNSDYSQSYSNPTKDTTLLPLAVRYADPKNGLYVIERPPFKIAPDFSKTKGVNRSIPKILQGKEIWIPWTVSIISMSNSLSTLSYSMFFNDKPLSSFDDPLMVPWIPNVFADGRTCFGESTYLLNQRIESKEISYTLSEIFNYTFNDFFSSWNADISLNNHHLFTIFSDLGFLERLKDQKRIPKQVFNAYDWYRNSHRAWPIILFALSTLSYQETMQLFAAVKQACQTNTIQKYSLKYRLDRIASQYTTASFEYNENDIVGQYNTLIRSDHRSLVDSDTIYYKLQINVDIKNIPEGVSFIHSDKIKSPVILTELYSHFFAHLNSSFDDMVRDGIFNTSQHATLESLLTCENLLSSSFQLSYLRDRTSTYGNRIIIDWNTL